ncbi:hypothetical protein KAH37_01360 [bacterium]|nr:hypothetical protein [bacterium]
MINFKRIIKTWRFKYGVIALFFGLLGSLTVATNADAIEKEYQQVVVEEGCFTPTDKQKEEWKNMTQEARRIRSERCMSARNKSTQMKFGPPVLHAMAALGIFLILLSLITIQSKGDKMLELMEQEEEKEKEKEKSQGK